MTSNPGGPRKRVGRPPAGARAGERVKDYPQLSVRLPGDVKSKLEALSLVTARPQWRLVSEAIDCYLRARPDGEQRLVDQLTGRARGTGIANRPLGRRRGPSL